MRLQKFITEQSLDEMGFMAIFDEKYKNKQLDHPSIFKKTIYQGKLEVHFNARDRQHAFVLVQHIAHKLGSKEVKFDGKNIYIKEQFISEGGNAVSGVVRMNSENFKDTLNSLIPKLSVLGLTNNDIAVLGSGGKKGPGESHGDIDIAVSIPTLLRKNKSIKSETEIYSFIESKLKSLSKEICKMESLGVVSFAWPIVSKDGKQKGQYVQIDLMPTPDLDFSDFAYWSPTSLQSQYKGVHRNLLFIATTKYANMEKTQDGDIVELKRFMFNMNSGLSKVTQSNRGARGALKTFKTLEKTHVTNSPDEIIKMVLGKKATRADLVSFETLYRFLTSAKYPNKEHLKDILSDFKNGIEKMGILMPKELA